MKRPLPHRKKAKKNILLLDLGAGSCGAVVWNRSRNTFCHWSVLQVEAKGEKVSAKMINRAKGLFSSISYMIDRFKVDLVLTEVPTGGAKSANAMRAMTLAIAVMGCVKAAHTDVEFVDYTPYAAKKLAGDGSKEAVKNLVLNWFKEKVGWENLKGQGEAEHLYDAAALLIVHERKSR